MRWNQFKKKNKKYIFSKIENQADTKVRSFVRKIMVFKTKKLKIKIFFNIK